METHGRYGDNKLVHVSDGEVIVPKEIQTPEILALIDIELAKYGQARSRYTVGGKKGSINPVTGYQEFFLQAILGSLLVSGITSLLSGGEGGLFGGLFGDDKEEETTITAGKAGGAPGSFRAAQDAGMGGGQTGGGIGISSLAGAGLGGLAGLLLGGLFGDDDNDNTPSASKLAQQQEYDYPELLPYTINRAHPDVVQPRI